MPTNDYQELVTQARENWSPDARRVANELADRFAEELNNAERLGAQLAHGRKAKGLTQEQLAKMACVQQADISRIERGLGNPTRDTLIQLANELDLEIALTPKPKKPLTSKNQERSRM